MALVGASPSVAFDDPERLLDEWLGELDVLSAGLESSNETPKIDSYRFSMANLEETQDADLDAILGELSALQNECEAELSVKPSGFTHTRSHSEGSEKIFRIQQQSTPLDSQPPPTQQRERTDSPDNDSAFSDTLSLLSSESSASSSISSKIGGLQSSFQNNSTQDQTSQSKVEKIKIAMEKIKEASIKKLLVKAFSLDGSSKSLLVDETITCGQITRLLADKNHLNMEPKWAVVEYLPDLLMERVYEDHELLVGNLMYWTSDSKNKIIFCERPEKISLFQMPEKYLLAEKEKVLSVDYDEQIRTNLLEDFFNVTDADQSSLKTTLSPTFSKVPTVEGPLYLKSDIKKGWKKYHFVLSPSGIYYCAKEKVKSLKELVCLASFDTNEVYLGVGWRKKYKAPTEFCFAIKHPKLQQPKCTKYVKFLCADDQATLQKWITGMRIAKHGRRIFENYRALVEELAQEDLDHLAQARSTSVVSIASGVSPGNGIPSSASSGRSSVSSGCLSDGSGTTISETGFECEFPMGTIKRKPAMKPNIPLTSLSRQLRDAAGASDILTDECKTPTRTEAVYTTNGTLTRVHSRTRSSQSAEVNIPGRTSPSSRSITPVGSITRALSRTSSSLSYGKDLINQTRSSDIVPEYLKINNVQNNVTRNSCSDIKVSNDTVPDSLKMCNTNDKSLFKNDCRDYVAVICDGGLSCQVDINSKTNDMFRSTSSLDSLPLPPPPIMHESDTLDEMGDSQLSLPPPPPPFVLENVVSHANVINLLSNYELLPKKDDDALNKMDNSGPKVRCDKYPTPVLNQSRVSSLSFATCIAELQEKSKRPSVLDTQNNQLSPILKLDAFNDITDGTSSMKKNKRLNVSFVDQIKCCNDIPPALPAKPSPPKRNEGTRLTQPKKLSESPTSAHLDFLKDLQRVMKKKWQVAQKCILEPTTTPHEVLGFREYPLSEDYKETSVSNWVEEHCGIVNQQDNLYENLQIDSVDVGCPSMPVIDVKPLKKRPAPPPPKRSNTTQLSFTQNNVIYS